MYSFTASLLSHLWMILEELKQAILLKTGLATIASKDCNWIAAEIARTLNRNISATTVQRVFGFAKSKHHFSKYTITILYEYAGLEQPCRTLIKHSATGYSLPTQSAYISNIKLRVKMEILSFISTLCSCLSKLNYAEPHLHPDQLVITAIKILLRNNLISLPICENDKCIGMVYTQDLQHFVYGGDAAYPLITHKLNFNLRTAITVMRRGAEFYKSRPSG